MAKILIIESMYKMSRNLTFTVLLALAFALAVNAQDTKVTMNADGSYSVIEYPVGKEVTVNLMNNIIVLDGRKRLHTASILRVILFSPIF